MKRLIFMQFCMLVSLANFDPEQFQVAKALEVNTENLSTWLGSEIALQAAVNGGKTKDEIVQHCANNKHEKSIEAACLIATRL